VKLRHVPHVDTTAIPRATERTAFVWIGGGLGIVLIGGVDYFSGIELRVFPLYYVPISLVAWHRGRRGAVIVAVLCAMSWFASNALAGLRFSYAGFWAANTLVQGLSFATVGLLIATLRRALMHERALSRVDPLTALLNTRAFYEEARRLLALCRRKQRPITVAYIDLDNFKAINDRYGHQAGDDLLCRVAGRLRASIRPSDILARLGGDEFAVMLPEVNPHEAAAAVERLRSLLADTLASSPIPITGSIGGVTFITAPDDVEYMVRQADSRMYVAKRMGKNRIHLEVADQASGDSGLPMTRV
jgi:diguanylate cyclase (GGDEF)-like protein